MARTTDSTRIYRAMVVGRQTDVSWHSWLRATSRPDDGRDPVGEGTADPEEAAVDRGAGVETDGGVDEPDETRLNISESADKIRVETQVKRGGGTRDEDRIKVKVKGNDPDDVVDRLNATVANLRETADDLRRIQPDGGGQEDDR